MFQRFLLAACAAAVLATGTSAFAARRQDGAPPPAPVSPSDQAPKAEAAAPAAPAAAPAGPIVYPSACCEGVSKCCDPCISYRHRRNRCFCNTCCETTSAVLQVKDPCCCCCYDVPVCLPACLKGAPCVSCRCGIFGRTIVEYSWDCGYRVEVTLTKHGKVLVTYFG